jgi:succinate dehydrogenase / fumarate reductase membrane anchor subunit
VSRQASGLRAWLFQRLTGIYMAIYFIYLILSFIYWPPHDYSTWLTWVNDPLNGVGLMLFMASILLHAWVGIRDVMIDYVQIFALRLTLLSLLGLMLAACGIWAARIILVPLII